MTSWCDVDTDFGPDDSFSDHDDDPKDQAVYDGHTELYYFRGKQNFILFLHFCIHFLKTYIFIRTFIPAFDRGWI